MNADSKFSDMNLACENETRQIIGCSMEVMNSLGHGFLEKPYENALVIELGLKGIACRQQPRFQVVYKGEVVGEYVPDLVVYGNIIVDTKVIDRITEAEIGQMLNYLRVTGLKVGLIINFKHPKLEWKRVVLNA